MGNLFIMESLKDNTRKHFTSFKRPSSVLLDIEYGENISIGSTTNVLKHFTLCKCSNFLNIWDLLELNDEWWAFS